ncbi:MAG: ribonuclease HII [Bacteroidales bacterium]|nr:ribonuclease HII [Bacteroidales bacterium]
MLEKYLYKDKIEAGCDEAGRGCLAGPVCAAAVIMPVNYSNPHLNDSKKLSESRRYKLRTEIEHEALAYSVAFIDNIVIDKLNILRASIMAMHRAIENLKIKPEFILVDGNKFIPYRNIPYRCIVKGDSKYNSIAAASVLAKTYRDNLMDNLHSEFNKYGWNKNKGYPTQNHREAIAKYGVTKYHRSSFQLLNFQLELEFERT